MILPCVNQFFVLTSCFNGFTQLFCALLFLPDFHRARTGLPKPRPSACGVDDAPSRRCYRYLIDIFDINMYVYVLIYIYIYIRYVLIAHFLLKNDVIIYLCIYIYNRDYVILVGYLLGPLEVSDSDFSSHNPSIQ